MADLTGQRVSQYLILERISKGATSTVYKAYQEKLERYVAVKVLSPHFIDEEGFLERFKQEARAVAQLDHPNILPVYDFDQLGELVYIVMKYVDTGTLKDLMGAPMDLRAALEIFTQIGLALGYAHRQGVIHRDVKPGNILLGEGNWALLTDFGLAKIRAGDRKLTKSGIGMGTPDYMAPEQAQGLPVDARADMYSLGCMLHEMLTGKVPFEADSGMAVVVKHITEPPRPPREINPKLPLAAEQVILRSLEKDPNRRYQTAESMVADLARAVGRADQFVLPDDLSSDVAEAPPRRAAKTKPVAAGPTPLERTREWIGEQGPIAVTGVRRVGGRFRARLRRLGNWIAMQLRRMARAIRAGFAQLGRWLRRIALAMAARARNAASRLRDALANRTMRLRESSSKRTIPASTRSRSSRVKMRSKASARSKSSKGRKTARTADTALSVRVLADRVRGAVQSARERSVRRRVAVAGAAIVIILLVMLFLVMRLSASANSSAPFGAQALDNNVAESVPTELPSNAPASSSSSGAAVAPEPTQSFPDTPAAPSSSLPEAPQGMVVVTGDTFKMGATSGNFDPDETPPHWVTVAPFYIDTVEVSVARFANFVRGSGYVTDAEKKGDATTWRVSDTPDRQRFPITRVSWNDATAFCRWYGKRLPTEAEWELAAKGYTANIYSWGNTFSQDRTNTRERGVGQPIAIASLANVTPFGAYDMIGNVWEWVSDWYGGDYYALSPSTNPQGPASGLEKVIRGGSFKSVGDRATTTIRRKASQDGWSDDIGFRCAKDIVTP